MMMIASIEEDVTDQQPVQIRREAMSVNVQRDGSGMAINTAVKNAFLIKSPQLAQIINTFFGN